MIGRLPIVALALASAASMWVRPVPNRPAAAPRFEGEFGLFVRHVEEGLEVHWVTERSAEGTLRAYAGGERIVDVETPASQAHRATVPVDAPEVVLEYGALDEPEALHRTRVWLEPVRRVAEPAFEASDSVYVVGDVHGEYDALVRLLRQVGLVDADLRWSGGRNRLVFLGDLFDRGADVTGVLWLLYRLEREAEAAGGRLHLILGNHEVMVMGGDLRYVSGKEGLVAFRHGVDYAEMFHPRRSVLGRWLAAKPILVRMDDILLAHGGVSPPFADYSLREVQDSLARFLDEELFLHWHDEGEEFWSEFVETTELDSAALARRYDFFFGPESILWYRGLVNADTLGAHLERVLDRHDSRLHVVGHSIVEHIEARYGGRLIAVDVPEAATELLLLVRGNPDWKRLRVPTGGPPEPVPVAEPAAADPEAIAPDSAAPQG